MADYPSTQEIVEKWGVSERRVAQYCAAGRVPGAQRIGKTWAVPSGAEKPVDPRKVRRQEIPAPAQAVPGKLLDHTNLMPLMNTDFAPGRCREAAESMAPGPRRDIALATDGATVYGTIEVGGKELTNTQDNPVVYAKTDASGAVTTTDATAENYNIMWDGETLTLRNAAIKEAKEYTYTVQKMGIKLK